MSDSGKAVFLSYASQDKEVAKKICDALRAAGIEVWFDVSELRGGDAWDQKIRKQIKECALFMPVITPNTNSRPEGYFRLEWKLAVDRSHLLADDHPFLFPIAVGDINDATARVPDKFREVQWTKLRLDETPAELASRVTRLLGGEAAVPARPSSVADDREDDRSARRRRKAEKPAWLRHAWSVMGLLIVAFYVFRPLWRDRGDKRNADEDAPPASVAPATPPATVSPARKLAEQARTLFEALDSTPDDFAAAEGLLQRALEQDSTDGVVWAISSRLNSQIISRGFERGPARRETARSQAERAVKLAPESSEAWLALGRGISTNEPARAEEAYRRGLVLAPNDGRLLLGLGSLFRLLGRHDEALAVYRQAAERPETKVLALYDQYLIHLYDRNYAEADRSLRAAIADGSSTNMVAGLAMLRLIWKGDVAGAQQVLADCPVGMRTQPRVVLVTALIDLMARQPEEALRTLDRVPSEYINDAWFTGPKALLIGLAHRLANRPEAARIAWESGVSTVRKRLQDAPTDPELHLRLGELLAWTGQTEAALQEARAFDELLRGRAGDWTLSSARIHAILGRADDAVPMLAKLLTSPPTAGSRWPLSPAVLRLDPLWDQIRNDHRFQQLLEEPAAPVAAREWPKNPELKKAMVLAEGLEAIPDDFALAEQIVKPILDRAPTDVEAVTVMARIQGAYLRRGFDRSDERFAQARLYSERALQLAPDDPDSMLAIATYLFSRATDAPRAERLLRRAMELDPANPRHGRLLADQLNVLPGRQAEALAVGRENVRRFPADLLAHYDLARYYKDQGKYEDFDRELDATLALAPLPNAIVWKARLEFGLHNNFPGMKAWLDKVPERVRGTERAVFSYFLYAAFGNDPATGLEMLRGFPQKWFTDFEYAGPTSLLNAELLAVQGKRELARQQYEVALVEIQRMRATDPGRAQLNQSEFWVLFGLGRKEEARAIQRRLVEGVNRPFAQSLVTGWWFSPIPGLLLMGERATALELLRESLKTLPESRAAFRNRLELDPRMAPFRDDAEIKALLGDK